MTKSYLTVLRTVLVAVTVVAVAIVPLSTAFAQQTVTRNAAGLEAKDSAANAEQTGRISKVRGYARGNYVWPYATGPSYGGQHIDYTRDDVLYTPAGAFDLTTSLATPQPLATPYQLDQMSSQVFVVQYHADLGVQEDLVQSVESAGGKVLAHLSGPTFVAELNRDAYNAINSALGLTVLQPYQAAFKLSPKIGRSPLPDPVKALSDVYTLEVGLWSPESLGQARQAIESLGGIIRLAHSDTIIVDLHRTLLADLAGIQSVKVVNESLPIFLHAEETTTTMQTGQYNEGNIPYHLAGVNGGGLAADNDACTGAGTPDACCTDVDEGNCAAQVMMQVDSGISLDAGDLSDERTVSGPAGPSHRKVVEYQTTSIFTGGAGDDKGCDAPAQGGFTHGHVVAAAALGNGSDVPGSYNGAGWLAFDPQGNAWKLDGVAPGAKLVAYDAQITPPNGSCSDPLLDGIVPGDLYQAGANTPFSCPPSTNCPGSLGISYVDFDARVFNFSWGAQQNTYSTNAQDIDLFLATNKDAMVFISAGNAGADDLPAGGDGIPDEETLGTPATAKNSLTIGASRNANTVNSPESREFFSSMGPAVDTTVNRIAPQLMAPGGEPGGGTLGISSEFSCRSADNDQTVPVQCDIISGVEGTSFASPASAGAAMLVRDYFAQGFHPNATQTPADSKYVGGAMVKAILIASADYMTGANLTRVHRFNNEQGYGRIQLDNALPLEAWPPSPTGLLAFDPTYGTTDLNLAGALSNALSITTATFTLCDDEQELRVALAWIDRASSSSLVHNLNLQLDSPSGLIYRGNFFTDDHNKSGVIDDAGSPEDCGPIGAVDVDAGNGEVDTGRWSLPICSNSLIEGKGKAYTPFDNANPTEAIFLSPNPDLQFDELGDPLVGLGTCTAGSDNALGVCNNNIDCMSGPPVCTAGAGLCVCDNVDNYRQTEIGEWTITVRKAGTITGTQDYAVAVTGGVCGGSTVRFDASSYTCNSDLEVTVNEIVETAGVGDDPNATAVSTRTTIEVVDQFDTVVDSETNLTFTESTNGKRFTSDTITLTDSTARDPGNGALDVRSGDSLVVTYTDLDTGTGLLTIERKNIGVVNCGVRVGFGSIVFAQFGQDNNVLVQGGCERNVRNQFEFGFPDRYMDAGEAVIYNFAFNSEESIDLDAVTATLTCVLADTDSPETCLPNGDNCEPADCGGVCDPTRDNNPDCSNGAGDFLEILDSPKALGFLPGGVAMSANFSIQMGGAGSGEPFEGNLCNDQSGGMTGNACTVANSAANCGAVDRCTDGQPTPEIEMLLAVSASVSGKTERGLAVNRATLNVDELSTFYSTDYPSGGTEVVDGGPGSVGNNDEIASNPITEIGNFQSNDYRFETQVYEPLTANGKNANLLSPWNFDGNNGGFVNGLASPTDEIAASTFNLHNWGEDKNFNGVEDGVCELGVPGKPAKSVACYELGAATDPRCVVGDCITVENNKQNSTFDNHWNTNGGCGWQTKASESCSVDGTRGCFENVDCAGSCQVVTNQIVSTFAPCGAGAPQASCDDTNQCDPTKVESADTFQNQPCEIDEDCFADGDPVVPGACLTNISQSCQNDGGVCTGGDNGKGGVWHTGEINSTALNCNGLQHSSPGGPSACANFKVVSGASGQILWWELLATPVMEKVSNDADVSVEIVEFAWNLNVNLPDFNAIYSWEIDTDTETLDPVDLFADATTLGTGGGGYGAVANEGNPNLTRGFPLFASPSQCTGTQLTSGNGAPCESTSECITGLCTASTGTCTNGTERCDTDGDCPIGLCDDGPNNLCTAAVTPFACCTGNGTGTCDNGDCLGLNNPFDCCTAGVGVGTCGDADGTRCREDFTCAALDPNSLCDDSALTDETCTGGTADPNAACTGAETPAACCTGSGVGTCSNADCTAATTPLACCTGAGTGTCTDICGFDADCAPGACTTNQGGDPDLCFADGDCPAGACNSGLNAECTGFAVPHLCCTGPDTGSCDDNALCTAADVPFDCCTGNADGVCGNADGLECFADGDCTAVDDDSECDAPEPETCTNPELCSLEQVCAVSAGGVTVNGSAGNDREGDLGCFFEGAGVIPPGAITDLGLARPLDDDQDNDGDTSIDEYVQPDGPYRNHDLVAFNGPDMRFFTLEDIYGDTAETFQAAIGFIALEGTQGQQAQQSYGLAVDDVVVSWREFTLEQDDTDCAVSGSCAVIETATSNVFEGQTVIEITVLEATPPLLTLGECCVTAGDECPLIKADRTQCGTGLPVCAGSETCKFGNDCDPLECRRPGDSCLPNGPDNTLDCDGDGTNDLSVTVNSEAEQPGEVIFANQSSPGSDAYVGSIGISTLGDSPGVLFIEQQGASELPTVTVTYFDEDSDPNLIGGQPCTSDVDPGQHGLVQSATTIFIGAVCDITIVGNVTTDNGDADSFVDSSETVAMQITYINNSGGTVRNCVARIFSNSPEVDCILDSTINIGDIEPPNPGESGIGLSNLGDRFLWKLKDSVNRTDVNEALAVSMNVTMVCDECDALLNPQVLTIPLDLDIDVGGQTALAWIEGFETGFGKFFAENLDAGIPGASNAEGLIRGDGWRCQYSNPDWPNASSYGDTVALSCFPGANLSAADAIYWQIDGNSQPDGMGTSLNTVDSGRAHGGLQSMHYGTTVETEGGPVHSSPLADVESIATTDIINLGAGFVDPDAGLTLNLSWWHQISLVDGTFLNVSALRSADGGVVQAKQFDTNGSATSDWARLTIFQNSYDATRYDFYFNCMFDPVDDGNTEDDFFDPTDPTRRNGPSSTCVPNLVMTRLGDTDELFQQLNVGRATSPPCAVDCATGKGGFGSIDGGLGTWIESKVDLLPIAGRRVKLRYLATAIKASQETHEEQFAGMNGQWFDDGWWLDDIRIDESLTNPANIQSDADIVRSCSNGFGCVDGGGGLAGCDWGTCDVLDTVPCQVGDKNCAPGQCNGGGVGGALGRDCFTDAECVLSDPGALCDAPVPETCTDVVAATPCAGAAPSCGAICTSLTASVSTLPDDTGGAADELLSAPGQSIEIDASTSSGNCNNGALQFQFEKNGTVVRPFSENPVFVDAPTADADYDVTVRCSTDSAPAFACDGEIAVDVDVDCPSSGSIPAETITFTGLNTIAWTTAYTFEIAIDTLGLVSAYTPVITPKASAAGYALLGGESPVGSGVGNYYIIKRTSGPLCNELGVWTSAGAGECPAGACTNTGNRDGDLP